MATFQNVTLNATMVPQEVVTPLPGPVTADQFQLRLKTGGTMELIDSVWEIGPADFQNHSIVFAALDRLLLKGTSKIVTNGNTLVLFVNDLVSEDAQIRSFLATNQKAPGGTGGSSPGDPGKPGAPGIGGGFVNITIVRGLQGIIHFTLPGQDGGDGGGGVSGVQGASGAPGTPCQAGIVGFPPHPGCKHDGGPGGKGGVGSPGGHGGDGGTAGQGGTVVLTNVGDAPIPSAEYTYNLPPGVPGTGGSGGAGGPGGPGGPGGDGNIFCHGGPAGPSGDPGRSGDPGNTGSGNASGRLLQQNLDIEVVIKNLNSTPKPGILSTTSIAYSIAGEPLHDLWADDCNCG